MNLEFCWVRNKFQTIIECKPDFDMIFLPTIKNCKKPEKNIIDLEFWGRIANMKQAEFSKPDF